MNELGADSGLMADAQRSERGQFLMGIDTEWKPVRSSGEKVRVSIMQIACRAANANEFVLIFDLQWMLAVASAEEEGHEEEPPQNSQFAALSEVNPRPSLCRHSGFGI